MITPKLYGRLGNQAFQISAAIAHARRCGADWRIPRFTENMQYWPNYFAAVLPRNKITASVPWLIQYNEPRHCYDQIPRPISGETMCLNGYFQSEKYWPTNEEKEEIGNALGFHCKKQDYIAIHVRRGDFVSQFSDKHPPLPSDYYDASVDCFIAHGYTRFKIYSDDIAWCKSYLEKQILDENECSIEYSTIKDPLTDMRDMYNAAGFIIANSTFSLFPALLRLDQPFTIAPAEKRWYGPGNAHLETCDLMPERFIKI